ncbi:MAG: shikimate dehydrogenase [Firmicutes bacterium]|nr:shikimate dehydrogenase [Bacillota bacterium]
MEKSLALYAVFGKPIGHSLSPIMHNRAFLAQGIAAHYLPVECHPSELVDKLGAFLRLGGRGANLTRPLKEEILPFLAEKDAWVETAGAANTLCWTGTGWAGRNTDCLALDRLLAANNVAPGDALILGGGGVARATAAVLHRHQLSVVVAARRPRAVSWADSVVAWDERLLPHPWRVVVNATPLGQIGEPQELAWPLPAEGGLAVEWVYRPRRTRFVQLAEARNIAVVDGLTLLVEQAAMGWLAWFGCEGPREVMWEAIRPWLQE